MALPVAGSPRRKPQDNQPAFDLQTHLERISGVDFTQIDGMGALTLSMPVVSQASNTSLLGSGYVQAVVLQGVR